MSGDSVPAKQGVAHQSKLVTIMKSFSAKPRIRLVGARLAGLLCFLFWLGFSGGIKAEYGVQAWTHRYSHDIGSADQAARVVCNASGNLIVAGSTDEGVSGSDILVIKYSSAGNGVWTNRYNGPANSDDSANAVTVDAYGGVIVVGKSVGVGSGNDFVAVKYSYNGIPQWTNRYSGPGSSTDEALAVAVDISGNAVVSGYTWNGTSYDYLTIKYSNSGTPQWTNRFNSGGEDIARTVLVDHNGDVVVSGHAYGYGTTVDFLTIKYSANGVPVWTNRYDGPTNGYDEALALAVDTYNSVVVAGYSAGNGTDFDYAIVKYSTAGNLLWTRRYSGPAASDLDVAQSVAVDGNDNILVTGYSWSTTSPDFATLKFAGDGTPLWTNRYNGPGDGEDVAQAVVLDAGGNALVTGYSINTNGDADYLTIKYSTNGTTLWTQRYNGSAGGADQARSISVDGSGSAVVTGNSPGVGTLLDITTIQYSNSGNPTWTNRYNSTGNSDDAAQAIVLAGNSNAFVTGYSISSEGGYDFATIKYSSNGLPAWTNRFNGLAGGDDKAFAAVVDNGGNVIVGGYSSVVSNYYDYATIKYSNTGTALWTNYYNGDGNGLDIVHSMAVDTNGAVYVTGESLGKLSYDWVTIKYNSAGNPIWIRTFDGTGNDVDSPQVVVVDKAGYVIVAGDSTDNTTYSDFTTIKYSSGGTVQWTSKYNGPYDDDDSVQAAAVDSANNVIVTGYSWSTNATDFLTIKYAAANGAGLWTNRYNGSDNDDDQAVAVAVDASNNVYVTGFSWNAVNYDWITIKYASNGVAVWTNRFDGPGAANDKPVAIGVDTNGSVLVTGRATGVNGNYDYATVKYSSSGSLLWSNYYDGPAEGADAPQSRYCLAVDCDGAAYVTGSSDSHVGSSSVGDYFTLKYLSLPALPPSITGNPVSITNNVDSTAIYAEYLAGTDPLSGTTGTDTPTLRVESVAQGIALKFLTEAGRAYHVEESADLQNWNTLPDIISGDGNPAQITMPYAADDGHHFYRIRSP